MRKCDVCGTKIPFNATHCPNCGQQCKSSHSLNTSPKIKRQIDWKLVFRILSRVLIAMIVVYNVYSNFPTSQTTPNDYFENQYGENYDLKKFDNFNSFQMQYPELGEEIQPYYQLSTQRRAYERYLENSIPTGTNQTYMTVVNDQLHDIAFIYYIYDDFKDVGVFYELRRVEDTLWNEELRVDYYNATQEELSNLVKAHLYYIEEILDIDMEDEIVEISEKISNYYRAVIYVEQMDEYQLTFNYNANGDFVITVYRTIHNE